MIINAINFSSKANTVFPGLWMNTYFPSQNKAHEMVFDHSVFILVSNKKLQNRKEISCLVREGDEFSYLK